uniref:hypothetical protein n=1 Tax=Candidatus Scatousia sp. TaxID=3085663 RepID=UPI0040287879
AASVRPEPGSNSPLSESLFVRCIAAALDSFRLAFAICPHHLFLELTSSSFSAILLSMCRHFGK